MEKANYVSNKNELTFTEVEDGIKVDWSYIIFNNLCNELDRWIRMQEKMQTCGKQKDKKEICHSMFILERLFMYMFKEDSKVSAKKTTFKRNPRGLKRNYSRIWIAKREQQWDVQNLCKKRTQLKQKKDQHNEKIERGC